MEIDFLKYFLSELITFFGIWNCVWIVFLEVSPSSEDRDIFDFSCSFDTIEIYLHGLITH